MRVSGWTAVLLLGVWCGCLHAVHLALLEGGELTGGIPGPGALPWPLSFHLPRASVVIKGPSTALHPYESRTAQPLISLNLEVT